MLSIVALVWSLFALAFIVALVALLLLLFWKRGNGQIGPQGEQGNTGAQGPPTNPDVFMPIVVGQQATTLVGVAPLGNLSFTPGTVNVQYSVLSQRTSSTTVNSVVTLTCSNVLVSLLNPSPTTFLSFSFNLPQAIVGTLVSGDVSSVGVAADNKTPPTGPTGVLQNPVVISNGLLGARTFTLTYTFGGAQLGAGTPMECSFQISYMYTTLE